MQKSIEKSSLTHSKIGGILSTKKINAKKEKGFTLIELLAVIVILGIIMLIAMPLILNVINDARKGAFRNSVYGIIKTTELEQARITLSKPNIEELIFTYNDGVETSNIVGVKLNYKGTPPVNGRIVLRKNGDISVSFHNGKYCAEKDYNESKVIVTDKNTEDCITPLPVPTIELIGDTPIYVEINTNYTELGVVAKSINGDIINNVVTIIKKGNQVVTEVDTSKLGKYEIIYSVPEDNKVAELLREIIIRDTLKPNLIVPTATTLKVEEVDNFDYMDEVSVSDNSLEELVIKVSGNISRLPGEYEITYSAEDSSGNKSEVVRKITVVDNEAPVITILGDNPTNIIYGSTYVDMGAEAFDNANGDLTSSIVVSGSVNTTVLGSHEIKYEVSDLSGNTSTAIRVVNVIDNVKPTVVFGINGNTTYARTYNTTVTVNDSESGVNANSLRYIWTTTTTEPNESSITNVFSNGGTITSPAGTSGGYYLWILGKDNAGNTLIARSNIFNLDNEVPVVTGITTNTTGITHNSFTITRSGNATDAHSGLAANPYVYQRSLNNSTWTTVCTNNTTACNTTGLADNTTYYYRICANDNLGNQSCTASKSVRTVAAWTCGQSLTDPRDNKVYKTTQIGSQCWIAENLKYTGNGCLSKTWGNTYEACLANGSEIHYQWGAAMNGSTTPGAQGICPSGWHLPTDQEWKRLEGMVDTTHGIGNSVWDGTLWRGSDVGKKLKVTIGSGTDDYGFAGQLVGYRNTEGTLHSVAWYSLWLSSTPQSGSSVWIRSVHSSYDTVYRETDSKAGGYSVRCLKD